jgi:hypothetical protein
VEFRDQKGILRQDTTRSGRGVKRPAIGSRVVVLYDPTGKNDSELDSFLRRFGMPLAVAFLGGMFAIGAILAQ